MENLNLDAYRKILNAFSKYWVITEDTSYRIAFESRVPVGEGAVWDIQASDLIGKRVELELVIDADGICVAILNGLAEMREWVSTKEFFVAIHPKLFDFKN